jgi:hypothetical protein
VQTISTIMSHEFAEMVTDPLYNAWTPDHAGHEIGDYCEGQNTTITVSGRTWTVQQIWSDVADSCVASSAAKILPISPVPPGMQITSDAVNRLGRGPARALDPADVLPHHRVLPLPSVRFDHRSGEKQIGDAETLAYMRQLFSPLSHQHLFNDFPAFLHQAAAVLVKRAEAGGEASADDPAAGGEATPERPSSRRKGVVHRRVG